MKRIIYWLSISLLTFALGVVTAFLLLNHFDLAKAKNEAESVSLKKNDDSAEKPIFAFCELVNNPDKYDGKIVRVSAKLNLGHHSVLFLDRNCYGQDKATAVIFKSWEQQAETIDKIVQETKPEHNFYNIPEIITTGKFSRVKEVDEANSWVENFPFQFEIQEIEKVSR